MKIVRFAVLVFALTACSTSSHQIHDGEEPLNSVQAQISAQDLEVALQRHKGSLSEAIADQLKACSKEVCFETGEFLSSNKQSRKSMVKALPFWLKGCHESHAQSCMRMTTIMALNEPINDDDPIYFEYDKDKLSARLIAYAERACWLNPEYCSFWAGHALDKPKTPHAENEKALKMLNTLCKGKDVLACETLASRYGREDSRFKDYTMSTSFLEQACTYSASNSSRACFNYARALYAGVGVTSQPKKAAALMTSRCEPQSPFWTSHCQGEPGLTETCSIKFLVKERLACAVKANALNKADDADKQAVLRLLNVACEKTSFFFNSLDAILIKEACDNALNVHLEMKTPPGDVSSLKLRRCSVLKTSCYHEKGMMNEFCESENQACEAKVKTTP